MEKINLRIRRTYRYVDGWSYKDAWEPAGTLKVTPPKMVREPLDYDVGGAYVRYARLPAGADWRKLARAVQDTLSGSSCHHAYDCCGCASYRTTAKVVRPRLLQIRTRVSYNY